MEKKLNNEATWRVWIDTDRRIVSFHEEEGCRMLEFRSRELFLSCVDQYTSQQSRRFSGLSAWRCSPPRSLLYPA